MAEFASTEVLIGGLVQRGIAGHLDLDRARQSAHANGNDIFTSLISLDLVAEDRLLAFLAEALGVRKIRSGLLTGIPRRITGLFSPDFIDRYRFVPLGMKERRLYIATFPFLTPEQLKDIEFFCGLPVVMTLVGPGLLDATLARYYLLPLRQAGQTGVGLPPSPRLSDSDSRFDGSLSATPMPAGASPTPPQDPLGEVMAEAKLDLSDRSGATRGQEEQDEEEVIEIASVDQLKVVPVRMTAASVQPAPTGRAAVSRAVPGMAASADPPPSPAGDHDQPWFAEVVGSQPVQTEDAGRGRPAEPVFVPLDELLTDDREQTTAEEHDVAEVQLQSAAEFLVERGMVREAGQTALDLETLELDFSRTVRPRHPSREFMTSQEQLALAVSADVSGAVLQPVADPETGPQAEAGTECATAREPEPEPKPQPEPTPDPAAAGEAEPAAMEEPEDVSAAAVKAAAPDASQAPLNSQQPTPGPALPAVEPEPAGQLVSIDLAALKELIDAATSRDEIVETLFTLLEYHFDYIMFFTVRQKEASIWRRGGALRNRDDFVFTIQLGLRSVFSRCAIDLRQAVTGEVATAGDEILDSLCRHLGREPSGAYLVAPILVKGKSIAFVVAISDLGNRVAEGQARSIGELCSIGFETLILSKKIGI